MIFKVFLWINISLFIMHEMDAVNTREWKMMIFLNRLDDNTGHIIFTLLHLPLLIVLFPASEIYFIFTTTAVSVLLVLHQFMHILFKNHAENRMNNFFSRSIISAMFINSCINLVFLHLYGQLKEITLR